MKQVLSTILALVVTLQVALPGLAQSGQDYLRAISDTQAQLYEKVAPQVVRLRTGKVHSGDAVGKSIPFHQFKDGANPFEEWFKQIPNLPQEQGQDQGQERGEDDGGTPEFYSLGIGSGIIVNLDSEGGVWILTNNHVLEDADRVDIDFDHETSLTEVKIDSDAESKDRNTFLDRKTDLAMIHLTKEQVGGRKLSAASFGDSSLLRPGQMVFTLGAPLDREWSFGQGIISGMGRDQVLPRRRGGNETERELRYEGFIQTTAFINVGNSGGPLLDIDGNVVGINVAIQTAGGFSNGFIGIGFAIPSNRAKMVVDQFIQNGKIVRGWLGVLIGQPDANDVEYYGLDSATGVKIVEVFENTPAKAGGMRNNDIVVAFNGIQVDTPSHLQEMVALAPVEEKAKVEVLRGGEKVELQIPIGVQPDEPGLTATEKDLNFPELGASLRNLQPDEVEYYKDKGGYEGVIVEKVEENGPLWNGAKIKKGTLITGIEDTRFKSVEDVRAFLDGLRTELAGKTEKLVMLKYVSSGSSGDVEEFQVIKLDFE